MSDLLEQAGQIKTEQGMSQEAIKLVSNRLWIRQLDPRVRIFSVAAFAITVVQLTSMPILACALLLAIVLIAQARLPFWSTAKRVAMMDGFIAFLLVMLPFTTPGEAMFTLWGFPASYEGLDKAIIILLKANAIVMVTMSLVGTMEAVTLGHALARLKVPEALVHLLLFTVRYIEVLHAEYHRLRTAMKCRGFVPSNSWHTYQSVGYLVGMLLIRSFERSERIMKAMKCRGFQGQFHLLDTMAFTRRDAVFFTFACLVMISMLMIEVLNGPVA